MRTFPFVSAKSADAIGGSLEAWNIGQNIGRIDENISHRERPKNAWESTTKNSPKALKLQRKGVN